MENLIEALKRCIPVSSLPMSYDNHEALAAELILELNEFITEEKRKLSSIDNSETSKY
jgi:hypothetical protein